MNPIWGRKTDLAFLTSNQTTLSPLISPSKGQGTLQEVSEIRIVNSMRCCSLAESSKAGQPLCHSHCPTLSLTCHLQGLLLTRSRKRLLDSTVALLRLRSGDRASSQVQSRSSPASGSSVTCSWEHSRATCPMGRVSDPGRRETAKVLQGPLRLPSGEESQSTKTSPKT